MHDYHGCGCCNLQESKTKHKCQADFFALLEMKSPDLRDRQEKDHYVAEDGAAGICKPDTDLVDALARQLGDPKLLHRLADEGE